MNKAIIEVNKYVIVKTTILHYAALKEIITYNYCYTKFFMYKNLFTHKT